MSKVDPRDFLLNTDYEMDKIILFKSGTINAGQYDVRIQHGLSFAPLIFGVFAYTDDFSGPRPMPYQYITPELTIDVGLYSDPTNLYLSYHNSSGTPATIYYRIYAFEPSDSRSSITPTSGFAKDFILNTDYNYCKLKEKGVVDASTSTTIQHNLGYLPQVLVWNELNGYTNQVCNSMPYLGGAPNVKVTEQAVIITDIPRAHYRIYYDEA